MKDDELEITIAVDSFRRLLRRLRVVARHAELATGLSPAQLFVLSVVADAPGCSVNQIAGLTLTDRSSVAAVIARLTDRGYLTRDQSPDDRRRASIAITPDGQRAMLGASPPPTTLLIAGIRQLPMDQLQSLTAGLVGLTIAMGIANEPAGMLFDDSLTRGDMTSRRADSDERRSHRSPQCNENS